jgi:hypothetical protein
MKNFSLFVKSVEEYNKLKKVNNVVFNPLIPPNSIGVDNEWQERNPYSYPFVPVIPVFPRRYNGFEYIQS